MSVDANAVREQVKAYYSKISLENQGEMATCACSCDPDCMPKYIRPIAEQIPSEIIERFYGCGSPIPSALEGKTVLDLGCGTGRDVYIVSKLVGESGRVIGVDMNEDQLQIARAYAQEIANLWGFGTSNVDFIQSYIEDLSAIGDESVDVVISNCVINLSPAKEQVFREVWRVLKLGGELYFSDIFADRRMSVDLSQNPLLIGECLGGAMYWEDFRRLMRKVGWHDFRCTTSSPSAIGNDELETLIGNVGFTSRTIRAFKLPDLIEDICENYGQIAIYKGGILGSENYFDLDDHHRFFAGQPVLVCGNTCAYLQNTRFASYFEIIGNRAQHFGAFEGCSTAGLATSLATSATSSGGNSGGCDCASGCC